MGKRSKKRKNQCQNAKSEFKWTIRVKCEIKFKICTTAEKVTFKRKIKCNLTRKI